MKNTTIASFTIALTLCSCGTTPTNDSTEKLKDTSKINSTINRIEKKQAIVGRWAFDGDNMLHEDSDPTSRINEIWDINNYGDTSLVFEIMNGKKIILQGKWNMNSSNVIELLPNKSASIKYTVNFVLMETESKTSPARLTLTDEAGKEIYLRSIIKEGE